MKLFASARYVVYYLVVDHRLGAGIVVDFGVMGREVVLQEVWWKTMLQRCCTSVTFF